MAETISGSVSVSCRFSHSNTYQGTPYSGSASKNYSTSLPSTALGHLYFATLNVTTTPMTIDLTTQVDAFGTATAFTSVKNLFIANKDATNNLTVGGGTNALFPAMPVLGPNSCLSLTTTITVDATHKVISLVASAGTISVDILAAGG